MNNAIKTTFLLATLTGLLMAAGYAIGGTGGMMSMLVVSALMNFGTWYFSDRIVLATSGAVPADDASLAWLRDDIAELSRAADMPAPRLYVIPHEQSPNAFATGRSPSQGVVAVTAGLLRLLDRRQIRGVLAHELGHIKHRDTLISAVAATMAGAIAGLGRMALWFGGGRDEDGGNPIAAIGLAIFAPIAATLLHMAVSRSREYEADARAAQLTRDPEGLAQALEGLAYGVSRVPMHSGPQAAHMIVHGFTGGIGRWFSTHPPIEERVSRLRAMR